MELNGNKKPEPIDSRYREVRQATESRSAQLKETVERVQSTTQENQEVLERLKSRTDVIEISSRGTAEAPNLADRSERIAELRASVEDGSLFDRDRLARAAEKLLSFE